MSPNLVFCCHRVVENSVATFVCENVVCAKNSTTCNFLVRQQISERRQMRSSQDVWKPRRFFSVGERKASLCSPTVFRHVVVFQILQWHWQFCGHLIKKKGVLKQLCWFDCTDINLAVLLQMDDVIARLLYAAYILKIGKEVFFKWPTNAKKILQLQKQHIKRGKACLVDYFFVGTTFFWK